MVTQYFARLCPAIASADEVANVLSPKSHFSNPLCVDTALHLSGLATRESSANWGPLPLGSCAGEEHSRGLAKSPRNAVGQASTSSH